MIKSCISSYWTQCHSNKTNNKTMILPLNRHVCWIFFESSVNQIITCSVLKSYLLVDTDQLVSIKIPVTNLCINYIFSRTHIKIVSRRCLEDFGHSAQQWPRKWLQNRSWAKFIIKWEWHTFTKINTPLLWQPPPTLTPPPVESLMSKVVACDALLVPF